MTGEEQGRSSTPAGNNQRGWFATTKENYWIIDRYARKARSS